MKKIILLILIVLTSGLWGYSQKPCNCQKLKKNAIAINQCPPLPIGGDKSTQVGLSAGTVDGNYNISITVRFKGKASEVKSDLNIRLSNNEMITLKYLNGGLVYIGNSEVAQAVFTVDQPTKQKLMAYSVKVVSFKLSDGLLRVYESSMNSDILKKHLVCL